MNEASSSFSLSRERIRLDDASLALERNFHKRFISSESSPLARGLVSLLVALYDPRRPPASGQNLRDSLGHVLIYDVCPPLRPALEA